MENFSLLGSLALRLHHEFVNVFYLLLPVFFALAIALDWFRNPSGSPDFLDTLKRAVIAMLLLVGFQEISEAILSVASGIADRISDMSGLDSIIQMAGEKAKSYTATPMSLVLGFNDLMVAVLSFASYVVLYFAQFITIALFHFMWLFLSILAPLLILFNLFRGTAHITANLFKSLIEVASYKIVWAVLSAMITALSFGNAYAADGNYLTVILLNFVIALAMLGTPMIVRAISGTGVAALSETLGMGAAIAMASSPARAETVFNMGREVLGTTHGYMAHMGAKYGAYAAPHMPGLRVTPGDSNIPNSKRPNIDPPQPPSSQSKRPSTSSWNL